MIRTFITSWALTAIAAGAFASIGAAQASEAVGPLQAPLGCPIQYSFSNDNPFALTWDPCGLTVYDAAGQLIWSVAPCTGPVSLQPGEISVTTWPQTDQAGNPVLPGNYFLDAPNGLMVTVGQVQTSIAPLGSLRHGRTRGLQLCSPQDPGERYLLLASTSMSTGFATCGGQVPLDETRILLASVANPVVFQRFTGRLDANGLSSDPAVAIPDNPQLAGTRLHFVFLVLDPQAPCRVKRISETASFTVF